MCSLFQSMMKAGLLTLAWSVSTLSANSHAASYDPDLTWRSLSTEHFTIHFHGGEEQLAEEMGHLVEEVYKEMTAELDWEPKLPTEVVLLDNTDSANGYATYLPRNTIVIFVTAPDGVSTLSFYEDWNDTIFTHEYTHILHLDTIEGLPAQVRKIFGRVVIMNGLAPNWVIEGQATMQETWQSNTGRGRGSIPDMIKRTATLENDFPPLGNMDGFQTSNPGGNIRYLFGQDFMNYIAEQNHDQIWTEWNHNYGGGIPYWLPARKTFGASFPTLYDGWKSSVEERYQQQKSDIEALGLSEYTLLTSLDRNCAFAHIAPDNSKLVYSCFSLEEGSAVYISNLDGMEEHIEIPGVFGRNFAWRSDGTAFAYSAMRTVNRFNLYSDVYLHTVKGGTTMLTSAKRARDPEFTLDGSKLLVVSNEVQRNQLNILTIDQQMHQLTHHQDHTQYSTPKFSPDGKWIATSMWQNGQRDLWILDAAGTPIRQLTHDMALDTEPRWSADGKTLYFTSDRTGVYNIFAFDLQSEILYQVSNVLTGAFTPSLDLEENFLYFSIYHAGGYAIAKMEIDKSSWREIDKAYLATEDAFHTHNFIGESDFYGDRHTRQKDNSWIAPEPNLKWWQLYEKRQWHSKASPSSELDTQILQYEGLTGIGAATDFWLRHNDFLGLPHQKPQWGEWDDSPNSGPDIQTDTTVITEDKAEQDFEFSFPVERYSVAKTLFPPRFIAPAIYQTPNGLMGSLSLSNTDTLRQHLYSASVSYRSDSQFIGWSVGYLLNKYIPVFSMGAYSYTVPYGNIYTYEGPPTNGGPWIPTIENSARQYWDKRIAGYLQATYAKNSRNSFFARWSATHRSPWIASGDGFSNAGLPDNSYRPYLPTRGLLSGIGGGWRYVKGASYYRSISPENTRLISIVGQIQAPWLGSYILNDDDQAEGFSRVQVTGEWREYTALPWGKNHVLATKVALGLSAGDTQRYGSFRLGGSFGESGYYTLPDEWRALRGFSPASISGDGYYIGAIEYRAPLYWLDWGYQIYPLFLRNISMAAFMDMGHAFDAFEDINQSPLMGTGLELRTSMIVSWGAPLSIRTGYAFGLNGGIPLGSVDGFYAWVGSSF